MLPCRSANIGSQHARREAGLPLIRKGGIPARVSRCFASSVFLVGSGAKPRGAAHPIISPARLQSAALHRRGRGRLVRGSSPRGSAFRAADIPAIPVVGAYAGFSLPRVGITGFDAMVVFEQTVARKFRMSV